MTSGIAKHGVRAGKERPDAFPLACNRVRVGKRTILSERFVHQVDADDDVAKTAELTNAHFDGLHGDEYALLVLADKELCAGLLLDARMGSALESLSRA